MYIVVCFEVYCIHLYMFWSVLYMFMYTLNCLEQVWLVENIVGMIVFEKVVFNNDETSKFGWCKLLTICHK